MSKREVAEHDSNHSHEALRVVELAVGVDDLGPRLEAVHAPRAGDVLHVGHAASISVVMFSAQFSTLKVPNLPITAPATC